MKAKMDVTGYFDWECPKNASEGEPFCEKDARELLQYLVQVNFMRYVPVNEKDNRSGEQTGEMRMLSRMLLENWFYARNCMQVRRYTLDGDRNKILFRDRMYHIFDCDREYIDNLMERIESGNCYVAKFAGVGVGNKSRIVMLPKWED